MNKLSRVLFFATLVMIVGSSAMAYFRFFVVHDYIVEAQVDCDPYTEVCFVHVCDPSAGEECTGDITEDTFYYKRIDRNVKNMSLCDPNDDTCTDMVCPPDEAECSYTDCDVTLIENGEVCSDPVVYMREHPIAAEGDATDSEPTTNEEGAASDGGENAQ